MLITVGIVLLTHPHTNWAAEIAKLVRNAGLEPKSNWIHRMINAVGRISPRREVVFGAIAVAYGVLEGVEAYGLARRRRWGEWLTVIATSLLLIPEIWELTKSTTLLKVGALVVNIAIVAYLLWRIRTADAEATVTGAPATG